MSQDLLRIPIRFNLEIPEHARLVSTLRGLNKNKYSSMSGFIIEALSYYVKVLSNDPDAGKDFKPGSNHSFVTKQDLDFRLDVFEKEITLSLYEKILPLISGGTSNSNPIPVEKEEEKQDEPVEETVDIGLDPDIMSSISSWIE